MDDLIRRSDAIKAVEERSFAVRDSYTVKAILRNVPSADSEVVGKLKAAIESEEICKNCPTAKRISSENLLGAMALGFSYGINTDRPQGEWIKHDDERDYCSRCKHIFKTRTLTQQDKWTTYVDDLGYNYCPNCGARMRPKLQGTHFDSIIIDECAMKGAGDESTL